MPAWLVQAAELVEQQQVNEVGSCVVNDYSLLNDYSNNYLSNYLSNE